MTCTVTRADYDSDDEVVAHYHYIFNGEETYSKVAEVQEWVAVYEEEVITGYPGGY